MFVAPPTARPLLLVHRLGKRLSAGFAPLRPFLSHLPPVPLAPLQPLLRAVLEHILRRRPDLADRLGDRKGSLFMIDATSLPFALLLRIDPDRPLLRAVHRNGGPATDASVSGNLFVLMDMVDGRLDGDALFFNRDLKISGDTEAVVRLRNALDDLDGSVIDDVADFFGRPGRSALRITRQYRAIETNGDEP